MTNQPNKKRKNILLYITISFLSIIIAIVGIFAALISIGKNNLLGTGGASIIVPESIVEIEENDGKIVIYNGKQYRYNDNITNILLIGVDREKIPDNQNYGANGQADLLVLLSLDTSNGKINAIPISRDTMTDVNQYSESGQFIGVSKEQICLSYSYGDGKEKSCKNTVTSVSRYLYGMPINSYIAFDLKAIEILNDSMGGVNIVPNRDFTLYGKQFKKGQAANLKGEYAIGYIRGRDDSLDANNERMNRQKKYMQAFFKTALEKTKKDITVPIKMYNKISNYKVSNIDVADISFLTQCVLKNGIGDIHFNSISGKNIQGEKFIEFHSEPASLYDTVINTFYIQSEK